ADPGPGARRRGRGPPAGGQPPAALLPLDLPPGRDREHSLQLSRGGSLRLAAEYDPSNARLRVRLISAEDLYDALVDLRSINCCVSLDLPPGRDREHSLQLSRGGSLRLAAEYDPSNARLRVRLISAEDLYDALVDLRSINCCVSLCLNPGKLQKQRSTIVKNSRNPVFNEDFFFDGLGPGHARKMSLKLKVVNKGSSLKRDTLLGEKELPLTTLLSCL
ncbi:PREDICTED: C2 calcium-dependent domain-containing protein 4C, partial [Pygoscelis adeliae]|uniref:C2 calcium-dependent domain-containing protein 4C n=1 Tax=Pygoscelis adeliae TaxID=9238 RepID=UPI0004F4FBD5